MDRLEAPFSSSMAIAYNRAEWASRHLQYFATELSIVSFHIQQCIPADSVVRYPGEQTVTANFDTKRMETRFDTGAALEVDNYST